MNNDRQKRLCTHHIHGSPIFQEGRGNKVLVVSYCPYSLRKSTTYVLQGKSSCQSLAVKGPLSGTCLATVVTNDYFLTTECKYWVGLLVQYEIIDCPLLRSICLLLPQVILWECGSVPNFIRCLCKEPVRTLVAKQAPSFLSWFDSGNQGAKGAIRMLVMTYLCLVTWELTWI